MAQMEPNLSVHQQTIVMASIVDYIIQLLCQRNTASQCQQMINQQPDIANQLFFGLLLPSVFLILLVYIVSDVAIPKLGKKFKTLIGIIVFIGIILQGYYYLIVSISQLWLFFIGLLAIWVFIKYFIRRKGEGKGGGGEGPSPSGVGGGIIDIGKLGKRVTEPWTGDMKDKEKQIKTAISKLEGVLNHIESSKGDEKARAINEFNSREELCRKLIDELKDLQIGVAGKSLESKHKMYHNHVDRLVERFRLSH